MNNGEMVEGVRSGKYKGIGGGRFLVKCHDCEKIVEASWGRAGPGDAPRTLRNMGWRCFGKTFGARWLCNYCGPRFDSALSPDVG